MLWANLWLLTTRLRKILVVALLSHRLCSCAAAARVINCRGKSVIRRGDVGIAPYGGSKAVAVLLMVQHVIALSPSQLR